MARTVSKWIDFRVSDSGGTIRSIPISSINGVGLQHETVDLTAFQDAVKGGLPGHPSGDIEISGPFDTAAAATAPALSGSHTILSAINGLATPLSLGVFVGMGAAWTNGNPVFGLAKTATSGYICTSYTFNPNDGTYSAHFTPYPGSAKPDWGTTAIT